MSEWLRSNASDTAEPRETGIPDCDDVYSEDNKLSWTNKKGEKKDLQLRSLGPYITRAKET